MSGGSDRRDAVDDAVFLRGFLDEDNEVIDALVDSLGPQRCVLLMSSLLAVLTRETFGSSISLETLSAYAKELSSDPDNRSRRIVVEAVLRTGAGYQGSLSGLAEEEILDATVVVLRRMCRKVGSETVIRDALTDRAVRLAHEGTIVGG
jgi:hypothetical protein